MSQQSDPHETPHLQVLKHFLDLNANNENIGCLNNSKQNLGCSIPFDGGCRDGRAFWTRINTFCINIVRPYNLFQKNMFDKFNIYDCGDVNTNPFNIEKQPT